MDKVKELFNQVKAKLTGKPAAPVNPLVTTVATKYEINLVPEVKAQMIRAQKIRNLVLYICIVVSVASISVVLVLFGIKSGQDIAMANQDSRLAAMSAKLLGYDELGDLVTIQAQLDKLSDISENKTVLSRVFGALGVMLPTGDDVVQLSDLRVDLETGTLRMEGQADARVAPLIDYRVLESFKKGVELTKYDYGRFVDANGTEIPTWCIKEADDDGNVYRNGENYYAWWDLSAAGCAALPKGSTVPENSTIDLFFSKDAEVEVAERTYRLEELEAQGVKLTVEEDGTVKFLDDEYEVRQDENNETVYAKEEVLRVKVWRTPQFNTWHNSGLMELDGSVTNIEHFESACIKYTGVMQAGSNIAKWTSTNDCTLAKDGLTVLSSSNGRDESDNLVLKFTATTVLDEEFFAFRNKHMIAIGPMGQNVTDSYVQIGGMFVQEARECDVNDSECLTNSTNMGGNE